MDLVLFGRVLWRFRFLVVGGLIVALSLAYLSYVRVSFDEGTPTLSYRGEEEWRSDAILLVTQQGFPWGRSVTADPEPVGEDVTVIKPPRFAESDRFETLAALYAALATSDPVRSVILESGPIEGELAASPVLASELISPELRSQLRVDDPLPLVRIAASADTPEKAVSLAGRAVEAFRVYLGEQQQASSIPENKRVLVTVMDGADEAELVDGRSKVYPALVALFVVAVTLVLAFVLENLRPRAPRRDVDRHRRELSAGPSVRRAR